MNNRTNLSITTNKVSKRMSEYCPGCCYKSMFTCDCGMKICRYNHCGRVYNGPYPSYINDSNKYHYICCRECGEKYANEVKISKLEMKEKDNGIESD